MLTLTSEVKDLEMDQPQEGPVRKDSPTPACTQQDEELGWGAVGGVPPTGRHSCHTEMLNDLSSNINYIANPIPYP